VARTRQPGTPAGGPVADRSAPGDHGHPIIAQNSVRTAFLDDSASVIS
jgi:hypothetical protein